MDESLKGKTALIIGGSGGLGKEIALELAKEEVNLIIHGSSQEKLEKLKNQIEKDIYENSENPKKTVEIYEEKFFSEENLKKSYTVLKSYIERSDILIVCYGPFLQKELHKTSFEDWASIVYWNYTFPGQLISLALDSMMKKGFGRILVFGGTRTYSINGYRTNAAYGGAKTALCSLVKSAALEYSKYGITCNAILPGFVETEYLSDGLKKSLAEKMPQGKLIDGKAIADSALFLLKNKSANGVLLNVDEGWMP